MLAAVGGLNLTTVEVETGPDIAGAVRNGEGIWGAADKIGWGANSTYEGLGSNKVQIRYKIFLYYIHGA